MIYNLKHFRLFVGTIARRYQCGYMNSSLPTSHETSFKTKTLEKFWKDHQLKRFVRQEGSVHVNEVIKYIFNPTTIIGRLILSAVGLKDCEETRKLMNKQFLGDLELFPLNMLSTDYPKNNWYKVVAGGSLPVSNENDSGCVRRMRNLKQFKNQDERVIAKRNQQLATLSKHRTLH